MGHVGVEWVMYGWGGVGLGGLCRVWWVIQGVEWAVKVFTNLICHKLGVLSFLLTNYCQLLSG